MTDSNVDFQPQGNLESQEDEDNEQVAENSEIEDFGSQSLRYNDRPIDEKLEVQPLNDTKSEQYFTPSVADRNSLTSDTEGVNNFRDESDHNDSPDDKLEGNDEWHGIQSDELEKEGWTLHSEYYEEENEERESPKNNGRQIKFLFEKKDSYDAAYDDGLDDEDVEYEGELEQLESNLEIPYDGTVPSTKSDEEFYETCMKISETAARKKQSEIAMQRESFRDPIMNYFPDEPPTVDEPTSEPRMFKCPSVESFFKLKRFVDVNFYLYPGSKMISKDCRLDATILQIKTAIGRFVKVPPNHLDIRKKKNLVSDEKTLADLGGKPQKRMKFTVEINKRLTGHFEISLPKERVVQTKKDTFQKVRIETGKT
jgi:hypothetical protein